MHNYDMILANRLECDVNLKPLYQRRWLGKSQESRVFDLKSSEDFVKYALHAESLGAFFSYMGSLIFLRDKWNRVKNSCQNMIGSGYIHVAMVLSFVNTERFLVYYLRDLLVKCRLGNNDFLRNDFARRTLLDLVGYEQFANSLLHQDLLKYRAFLAVLKNEVTNSLNVRRTLCAKFFSAPINYAFLKVYYEQLFDYDLRMKFKIADFIFRIPLISNLVKWLCLGMIKDTLGLKKLFLQMRRIINFRQDKRGI